MLEPKLVVVMDLLERDREGHLVVVDLKTVARKSAELQVQLDPLPAARPA